MIVIHRMFRHSFDEAPDLVRRVHDGDRVHTDALIRHLRLMCTLLRAHHDGEDERLWDLLGPRAPGCALHVERMRAQHEAVHDRLTSLEAALIAWEHTAAPAERAPVIDEVQAIAAALGEHLPDEEVAIVPVMEHVLTRRENAWFDAHGRAATPRGQMWNVVGAIIDAQPDGQAWLRANLPGPIRLAWRLVGSGRYARHRAAIDGSGT